MALQQFDRVKSVKSLPGVPLGTEGHVVDVYADPAGYEVEFLRPDGNTIAVLSCYPDQIAPVVAEATDESATAA